MTTKARWWNRSGVTVQKVLDSAAGLRSAGKWPESEQAQLDMVAKLAPQFKQIIEAGYDKYIRLHPAAWEALK